MRRRTCQSWKLLIAHDALKRELTRSWRKVTLNDITLADAILDRLLHNSIRLELKGPSMRKNKKHCKLEEAQQ